MTEARFAQVHAHVACTLPANTTRACSPISTDSLAYEDVVCAILPKCSCAITVVNAADVCRVSSVWCVREL